MNTVARALRRAAPTLVPAFWPKRQRAPRGAQEITFAIDIDRVSRNNTVR